MVTCLGLMLCSHHLGISNNFLFGFVLWIEVAWTMVCAPGQRALAPMFLTPAASASPWIGFSAVYYPFLGSPGLVIPATLCSSNWGWDRPRLFLAFCLQWSLDVGVARVRFGHVHCSLLGRRKVMAILPWANNATGCLWLSDKNGGAWLSLALDPVQCDSPLGWGSSLGEKRLTSLHFPLSSQTTKSALATWHPFLPSSLKELCFPKSMQPCVSGDINSDHGCESESDLLKYNPIPLAIIMGPRIECDAALTTGIRENIFGDVLGIFFRCSHRKERLLSPLPLDVVVFHYYAWA